MPEGGSGSIQLLEADPELARGLDPRRVREVSQRLFVRAVNIPRGPWSPGRTLMEGSQPIGLLVLDGLLVREATVSDHPSAELLGPGDLLRAWEDSDAEVLLPRSVRWSALTNARVAVIDHALAVRAAQWPEIFASLVERAARRAERLVVMQAIGHLTRVDDRLLALLWCLAERWGRVVPGGVVVSLRLPHRTLAGMVGARRPSVTTALGQLMARGDIERRPDGGWLLRGQPPEPRAVRLPPYRESVARANVNCLLGRASEDPRRAAECRLGARRGNQVDSRSPSVDFVGLRSTNSTLGRLDASGLDPASLNARSSRPQSESGSTTSPEVISDRARSRSSERPTVNAATTRPPSR